MWPSQGFAWPSLRFRCCVCTMTTWPYFDNLKFDVFDAVFLSATLSHLDCVRVYFHLSTEMQKWFPVFWFPPLWSIRTKLSSFLWSTGTLNLTMTSQRIRTLSRAWVKFWFAENNASLSMCGPLYTSDLTLGPAIHFDWT